MRDMHLRVGVGTLGEPLARHVYQLMAFDLNAETMSLESQLRHCGVLPVELEETLVGTRRVVLDGGQERWQLDENGERRTWWTGPAVGGPYDGACIGIEHAPMIEMPDIQLLFGLGADLDLIVTGSSDYHGTNKTTPIGVCTTDQEQFEAIVAAGTGSAPFSD